MATGLGEDLVCSVDLGTTYAKAAIVAGDGAVRGFGVVPAPVAGADAMSYDADAQVRAAWRALALARERSGVRPAQIAAVGFSAQRAGLVPLGAEGRPTTLAFSWQDPRGAEHAVAVEDALGPGRFRAITGLPPAGMWTLAKVLVLRDVAPHHHAQMDRVAIQHDYALLRSGAAELVTNPSCACSTGLFDIAAGGWHPELLALAGLTADRMPRIVPSTERVGGLRQEAAAATGLRAGTPLVAGGGDQQCAALGAGTVAPGDAALCLGTAAVLSCPVATLPPPALAGRALVTAHVLPGAWVVEAIHNAHGGALRWASGVLGVSSLDALEALAASAAATSGELLFLPFLAGIGSPDFDGAARGGILGLGHDHGRAELARAVIEGVAHETRRIVEAVESGAPVARIRLVGGGTSATFSLRVLRSIVDRPLWRCETREASLLGAAALAWTGIGRFARAEEAAAALTGGAGAWVAPEAGSAPTADRAHARYRAAVDSVRQFARAAETSPDGAAE